MAQTTDHSRLINAAATSALSPLGFQQKGRSRVWFADKKYWEILIEFTPSGFGKGSHLTVGAMWLWNPTHEWAFDYCKRLGGCAAFESVEQFKPVTKRLADLAASGAEELEIKFGSLEKITLYLAENISKNPWSLYHAAVAAGVTGDTNGSRALFDQLNAQKAQAPWHSELQETASSLARHVDDTAKFRTAIEKLISATRQRQKLPAQKAYF